MTIPLHVHPCYISRSLKCNPSEGSNVTYRQTGLVLFSVHKGGEQVRTYAIFRPYP